LLPLATIGDSQASVRAKQAAEVKAAAQKPRKDRPKGIENSAVVLG
jgi:hypothetical protein